jgi:hypothetical protein
MTPLGNNRDAKAVREENAILWQAIHEISGAPFGAQDVIGRLEERLGVSIDPITMEGLKAGQFTADELADRLPEVEAVLSGRPVAGAPVSRADVLAMTADEIADFGAERALAIVNGEANS